MWSETNFEDFIETSQQCGSVDELKRAFGRFVEFYGYENHVLTSVGQQQLLNVAWYELPADYARSYVAEGWESIDPILPAARRLSVSFSWKQAISRRQLSQQQKAFFGACSDMRVIDGIVIPVHSPGGKCEIFSLSRRVRERNDPGRLPLLRAVATQTWARLKELRGDEQLLGVQLAKLTLREIEVLKWTKCGKSNGEIAEILSIGIKAVEFHLRNIMDKLGVSNRVAAVVVALQAGWLD